MRPLWLLLFLNLLMYLYLSCLGEFHFLDLAWLKNSNILDVGDQRRRLMRNMLKRLLESLSGTRRDIGWSLRPI